MRCRMSINDKKKNVELAWGGSLGNPGHSVDGACVQHCHVAGESTAHTRKTIGWWRAIGELIAMQQLMHVSSALQQNCHSRALSQSGAERGEWTTGKEGKKTEREGGRRKPETNTWIENKARQIESYSNRKRERGVKRERVESYCWSVHAPDWSLHTCATHELHSEL